jgi:hypothetical protein
MIFFSCKLTTVDHFSAPIGRFHGSISSLQLIFWLRCRISPNSLTYLLDDHLAVYGLFSGRVFTSSGAPSFIVTFDSLINEILLHIKLAKITEDAPTGFILKTFFMINSFMVAIVCVWSVRAHFQLKR